jgi:transposase
MRFHYNAFISRTLYQELAIERNLREDRNYVGRSLRQVTGSVTQLTNKPVETEGASEIDEAN